MLKLDLDELAILLATSTEVAYPPFNRQAIMDIWDDKSPSQQVAYKLRARRMMKAWMNRGIILAEPHTAA